MTTVEPNLVGGLAGGILIGLSAVVMLAASGRIAGISGILGGLYGSWAETERLWRVIFLLGLIGGTVIIAVIKGGLSITLQAQTPMLIIAGLLVGFGTRLGGGCTSGHGVCGLARRSKRSFTATCIFISVAMLTVFVIRHQIA